MSINKFNITRSDYEIIANDSGIDFVLGAGIDMNSELPKGRNNFLEIQDIPKPKDVDSNEWLQSTVDYVESSRIEEYFKALSISIKGSYGLASGRLNYNRIINEQKNYFMVIFLITDNSVNNISLKEEKIIREPFSETSTEDDNSKIWQFLQDYGSHYINKISYGYQIAFEAKVDKSHFSDETKFSASINAAFGSFSATGSVNLTEINSLKTKGVLINGRITSGGISPDRPLTISSIDDLTKVMKELSNGDIIIKRGPYKLFLQSYWHILTKHPKTRNLFKPIFNESIKGEFGVPSGSIITYFPPVDTNVEELLNENEFYWLPEGWAICNGTKNTPNLIDKFIMGSNKEELGITGGTVKHAHTWEQVDYDVAPDKSYKLGGTIFHEANHLPPFYKLIYIMRL